MNDSNNYDGQGGYGSNNYGGGSYNNYYNNGYGSNNGYNENYNGKATDFNNMGNYGESDRTNKGYKQSYNDSMINHNMPYEIDLDNSFSDTDMLDRGQDSGYNYQENNNYQNNDYQKAGYSSDMYQQQNMYQQQGMYQQQDMYQENSYEQEEAYQNAYQEDVEESEENEECELEENEIPQKGSKKYKKYKRLFIFETIAFIILVAAVGVVYKLSSMDNVGREVGEDIVDSNTKEKKGYRTIALLGLDDAEENGAQRSDTIVVMSIDQETGEIRMASIMRDSYLFIDGWKQRDKRNGEFTKINAAYTMNGAESTLKAINQNLALRTKEYATIDFVTMAKVIDALGGIEIPQMPDIDNFIHYVNKFGWEVADSQGDDYEDLDESYQGKTNVKLTGYQALAYCRVRKSLDAGYPLHLPNGDSDADRVKRQKEVISLMMEKIKKDGTSNIGKLFDIFSDGDNLSTSFTLAEIMELVEEAIDKNYHVGEDTYSFPAQHRPLGNTSYEVPDGNLIYEVQDLQKFLYPKIELTNSELKNVEVISNKLEGYRLYFEKRSNGTTSITRDGGSSNNTNDANSTDNANDKSNTDGANNINSANNVNNANNANNVKK